MEVSVRMEFQNSLSRTLQFGSDEDTTLYCQLCDLGGKHVVALGYCHNCREDLCSLCIESHDKRHFVDRTAPRAREVASDPLPKCASHQTKEIKLYCRAHGIFGCVTCMKLRHKLCEIDCISDVSQNYVESEEYLTFERYLESIKELCAKNKGKVDESVSSIRKTCLDIIKSIKSRKKEIINSLNTFEKELEETVSEYSHSTMIAMNSLKSEYEALISKISKTESKTSKLKKDKKLNSLYFEVKKAMAKVQEYQTRTYDLTTKFSIRECNFVKSSELCTVLTKENVFGSIKISEMELGPCNTTEVLQIKQQSGKINIRAEEDKKTCYATGLAFLSPDQLAVADKANNNVKIVDVTNDRIISKLALSSSPRDITAIPPDQLAVTLRDEKIIQLLSTASGLTKTDRIKTDGNCRGIEYCNETLIVTFCPDIQILNLSGQILQRFAVDQTGKALVINPKGVAVSPNHKYIYVTSFRRIIRLTRSGFITKLFKWPDLMGVAVSSGGSVFVCSKLGDCVLQLNDDLSNTLDLDDRPEGLVCLNETDGIKRPIGLAYSRARNILYVSCGKGGTETCDMLHAFKIL